MHRFSYKEIQMEQIIKMFRIEDVEKFNEGVADLLLEDYTENSIKYVLTKPEVQKKLYMFNDNRIRGVLVNEVRKYAYKKNDDRWLEKNQKKAEREIADKIRADLKVQENINGKKSKDAKGFVYFIQAVNGGPIKIGFSIKPEKRISELQVAHPYKLDLIGTIEGNMFVEKKLHKYLAHAKTYGEWFEADEIVLATIKSCLEHGYEYVKKLE